MFPSSKTRNSASSPTRRLVYRCGAEQSFPDERGISVCNAAELCSLCSFFREKLQSDRDMCSALYYHTVTMVIRPSADLSLASEPPHEESRPSRSTRTNYCPSFVRTSVLNHMASRLSSSFPTVQGLTCRAHCKTRHCVKKIHLSRNRHARESE